MSDLGQWGWDQRSRPFTQYLTKLAQTESNVNSLRSASGRHVSDRPALLQIEMADRGLSRKIHPNISIHGARAATSAGFFD